MKLPKYQFKTYFTVKCELAENSYKNVKFPVFHAKSTDYHKKTRCVETTRMSPPWILRRLANVSSFFNSLNNRLKITNYWLRSVSSSLLKFTRFIQGNNIAWANLDMIRNLQHLHMNKKSCTYKTLPFSSHWNFFWIKSVMWSE